MSRKVSGLTSIHIYMELREYTYAARPIYQSSPIMCFFVEKVSVSQRLSPVALVWFVMQTKIGLI